MYALSLDETYPANFLIRTDIVILFYGTQKKKTPCD